MGDPFQNPLSNKAIAKQGDRAAINLYAIAPGTPPRNHNNSPCITLYR
jgi:hypothetical protein